jgi:hypothetical protein
MVKKIPIHPHRIRKIPKQFSWLDHRLVRDRYIDRCSHPAAALYLFLVTVADAQGVSYYGDQTISERLGMDSAMLEKARTQLIHIGLIAYRPPLYQVLALGQYMAEGATSLPPGLQSLAQIFKNIGEAQS